MMSIEEIQARRLELERDTARILNQMSCDCGAGTGQVHRETCAINRRIDVLMPDGNTKTVVMPPPEQVALKNDTDKDPWHLAPWDAFRAVVKVMAFGAKKYSIRNWEKGFDWHRLHRASIEHLTSWWEGEDKDPETGYSHLWHAGCCVMFLIAHELRGIGKDDRPNGKKDAL